MKRWQAVSPLLNDRWPLQNRCGNLPLIQWRRCQGLTPNLRKQEADECYFVSRHHIIATKTWHWEFIHNRWLLTFDCNFNFRAGGGIGQGCVEDVAGNTRVVAAVFRCSSECEKDTQIYYFVGQMFVEEKEDLGLRGLRNFCFITGCNKATVLCVLSHLFTSKTANCHLWSLKFGC